MLHMPASPWQLPGRSSGCGVAREKAGHCLYTATSSRNVKHTFTFPPLSRAPPGGWHKQQHEGWWCCHTWVLDFRCSFFSVPWKMIIVQLLLRYHRYWRVSPTRHPLYPSVAACTALPSSAVPRSRMWVSRGRLVCSSTYTPSRPWYIVTCYCGAGRGRARVQGGLYPPLMWYSQSSRYFHTSLLHSYRASHRRAPAPALAPAPR